MTDAHSDYLERYKELNRHASPMEHNRYEEELHMRVPYNYNIVGN